MTSAASAPACCAIAVSSSVSSSLAEPVPGTNGTRSPISSAAALIAAARSAVLCADGSPVEPPSEMPWLPDSSCQRIRLRSPSVSGAPSAVNGETTGAIDPRIFAGSLRNRTGPLLSSVLLLLPFPQGCYSSRPSRPARPGPPALLPSCPLRPAGPPRLVGGLPAFPEGVKPVDG